MNQAGSTFQRAAYNLAMVSAAGILVSNSVSQALLALALAALLVSGVPLRLPPIRLPLALFMAGTIIALALSADPAGGRPQIRKFYVFLMLLVFYSAVRRLEDVRRLTLAWGVLASISSIWALVQFYRIFEQSRRVGRGFYEYYVGERITGLMSHWMTFGGEMMIVLLFLLGLLFFSPAAVKKRWPVWLAVAVIGIAIALGFTRIIWLGTAGGVCYLIWFWRRRLLMALPVLLVAGLFLAPPPVQRRFTSIFRPDTQLDSNAFRRICVETGWRMVRAHPWFGLGPEQVKAQFTQYLPPDAPNPLPPGYYGHLHNLYLQYAAERGILTLLAMLWLLGKVVFDMVAAIRKLPPGPGMARFVLHSTIAVVIAVLIEGLSEYNLGDSEVLTLLLVVISCGYLAAESAAQEAVPGE